MITTILILMAIAFGVLFLVGRTPLAPSFDLVGDFDGDIADHAEDIVTLVDEEGKDHDFQVVDIIEVEGREYALLLPANSDDPEQDEVMVLRFEEDRFEMIEDEAEFAAVVKVLEALNDDDEDEDQAT